jgi:hypothetical protein
MGVYAASAPYLRQSIRNGSSELSTIGATISLGRPSLAQWAHARSTRDSPVKHRLGEPKPKGDVSDADRSLSSCNCGSEHRPSSKSSWGGSEWWVRVREEAMRELSVGKQELCEERRGIEGILDLMSGRWALYGSPSPPLVRSVNELSRFATTRLCWCFTLCFQS